MSDSEEILIKKHNDKFLSLPKREIRAVIFDMDGTLIDSEPAYVICEKKFFGSFGIDYNDELIKLFTGRGLKEVFKMMETMYPDSPLNRLSMDERKDQKDEVYLSIAKDTVKPFPRTCEFAKMLVKKNIKIGLATGSTPIVVKEMFGRTGLASSMAAYVSSIEVENGKPDPDIFLETAKRLGVEPKYCLVLEDSRHGITAAVRAGMASIALPEPHAVDIEEFFPADYVVYNGASAFDPEKALSMYNFVS